MIYVGIVTYNSVADLPGCLAGLRAQTHDTMTVAALDNASTDGSAAWLREHAPDVRLFVNDKNVGYGRAHNRLIRELDLQAGDGYLALNPDAELEPTYIAALWDAIATRADIGWATGKLLLKGPDGMPTGELYSAGHGLLRSGFAFNIGYGIRDGAAFGDSREVFGAPGAAALYKAEMIANLMQSGSFFDPDMFMYAEDSDVDWRARRQGWRCWYVADAVATHRGSAPGGALKMEAVGNRYLSVLKNAEIPDLLLFNLPYIAAHLLGRLVVTPTLGLRLTRRVLSRAWAALRRRRPSRLARGAMGAWFRWSAQQPTTQRPAFSRLFGTPPSAHVQDTR